MRLRHVTAYVSESRQAFLLFLFVCILCLSCVFYLGSYRNRSVLDTNKSGRLELDEFIESKSSHSSLSYSASELSYRNVIEIAASSCTSWGGVFFLAATDGFRVHSKLIIFSGLGGYTVSLRLVSYSSHRSRRSPVRTSTEWAVPIF